MEGMDAKVFGFLLRYGMNPKHMGFKYAFDAITLCIEKGYIDNFGREVYQRLADLHGKSVSSVLKCIKNATDAALMRCQDPASPMLLLQNSESGSVKCGEFIASAAAIISHIY